MVPVMLHDGMMFSRADHAAETDRRVSDRLPFPGELIVIWHHDLDTPIRYRVIDAGDGGYRLRSSIPVLEGTTGIARLFLPDGKPLNDSVMVVWTRAVNDGSGDQEIGLRVF